MDGVGGRNTSIISLDELFSRNASGTWLTYLESWQHSQYASEEWARDMSNADVSRKPDTAVVLLNWSRLSNVVLQTKAYCSPALSDVVERVFIWNNRPGLNLSFEEVSSNSIRTLLTVLKLFRSTAFFQDGMQTRETPDL